ncbi:MAG: HD domain-containing protein [Saprospiraceae bacterium]
MDYQATKAFAFDKLRAELPRTLYYHGFHHTMDVLNVGAELCAMLHISAYETMLLKTAVLFHDIGFTVSGIEHERIGCDIARGHLPSFGYTAVEIEAICGMIMATKIPQSPQNLLEQIICDADLDYLGRTDFYDIAHTLFEELKAQQIVGTEAEWDAIQIRFLQNHEYQTPVNRERRTPQKLVYLQELRQKYAR